MKIPKGKSFSLWANQLGDIGVPKDFISQDLDYIRIPAKGYKGACYLTQDVNLNIELDYANPFEGLFGSVPDTVDFIANAGGFSFKNNKLSFLKYWRTNNPLTIDLQVTFETLVDPFYDVWSPVMWLMFLCLPGERDKPVPGALVPPSSTAKVIATKFTEFLKAGLPKFEGKIGGVDVGGQIEKAKNTALGMVQGFTDKYFHNTGYTFNLRLGDNYIFKNVIIKNLGVNFSTETCYALIWALNSNKWNPSDWIFNPYTKSQFTVDSFSQTMGALLAGATSLKSQVTDVLETFGITGDSLKGNTLALPLKADVNISIEFNEPLTKLNLFNTMTTYNK